MSKLPRIFPSKCTKCKKEGLGQIMTIDPETSEWLCLDCYMNKYPEKRAYLNDIGDKKSEEHNEESALWDEQ